MNLFYVMSLLYLFIFRFNLNAFGVKRVFRLASTYYTTSYKNKESSFLKINDVIPFKSREKLKREIENHSRRLCLNLNEKQLNRISKTLYEFFYFLQLKNIKLKLTTKKYMKAKLLPLVVKERSQQKFITENLKREGNYFVTNSTYFSLS